ncbi:DUF397 domain-containing protein [Streptomyces sp. 549]|uniref:DUF397 domain-containing protein n=1 Tax=Streptomyces sp. 549 TaxID=3049076 RepID=UPI0024C31B91|nr:DUF397 domain-containing protein [Streptomyces sp. 549]MDK1472261.1 DUF397 domain-containing protein [Streptomyces sp. 549]
MTTEPPCWVKSSYSENGGQCVEVATNLAVSRGTVSVRDSKGPAGPALAFRADAFSSFVAGVQVGDLGTV